MWEENNLLASTCVTLHDNFNSFSSLTSRSGHFFSVKSMHVLVNICLCPAAKTFQHWFALEWLRTGHEADSPQSGVQRHLDLHTLVLLQDDALHHDEPVVGGHGYAHQQQAAGSEHCGQDGQRTTATRTHLEQSGTQSGSDYKTAVVKALLLVALLPLFSERSIFYWIYFIQTLEVSLLEELFSRISLTLRQDL